jgi:hypothetical protein
VACTKKKHFTQKTLVTNSTTINPITHRARNKITCPQWIRTEKYRYSQKLQLQEATLFIRTEIPVLDQIKSSTKTIYKKRQVFVPLKLLHRDLGLGDRFTSFVCRSHSAVGVQAKGHWSRGTPCCLSSPWCVRSPSQLQSVSEQGKRGCWQWPGQSALHS